MMKQLLGLFSLLLLAWTAPAIAEPTFPDLNGNPVVDAANIIDPQDEAQLDQKLTKFAAQTKQQLVVATIPDLQGYSIEDYGYQLGRHWGIGQAKVNNGVILIVAPKERQMRIEVGYGLESIIPDGLAYDIINQNITPYFKKDDMAGGINAGVDKIMQQLALPPDQAQKIAAAAGKQRASHNVPISAFVWPVFILFFFILPMFRRRRGMRYGGGGFGSGVGNVLLWSALNAAMNSGRGSGGGSDWGDGGGFGGGGGFSGGGGSFGGGGASGSW